VGLYPCGHGLHGLKDGVGHRHHVDTYRKAVWLVVEADDVDIIHGNLHTKNKQKFPSATVLFAGDREGAYSFMFTRLAGTGVDPLTLGMLNSRLDDEADNDVKTWSFGDGSKINTGDNKSITVNDFSRINAGDNTIVDAGNRNLITVGDDCTVDAHMYNMIVAGNNATIHGGYRSHVYVNDAADVFTYDLSLIYAGDNCDIKGTMYSEAHIGRNSTARFTSYNKIFAQSGSAVACKYGNIVKGDAMTVRGSIGTTVFSLKSDGTYAKGIFGHLGLTPGQVYKYNKTTDMFDRLT